jgi:hypothetical protein
MNSRSLPEHNGEIMMAPVSYSKERDSIVDGVKADSSTPTRLILFDEPPMNVPSKSIMKVTAKADGEEQKKRRRSRKNKWTKPVGKPKRPLSAYNLFFAKERILMLGQDIPTPEQEAQKRKVHCKTHGKISFAVMARTIGARWRSLGPDEKKTFEDKGRKEKERYLIVLAAWKEKQKEESLVAKSNVDKEVEDVSSVATREDPVDSRPDLFKSDEAVSSVSVPDLNMNIESFATTNRRSLLTNTRGNNDSDLMRLILQDENRRRYWSLLQSTSNPITDSIIANRNGYYSQIENQTLLHGLSRLGRVPTSSSGLIADRDLLSYQNSPYPEQHSSQYLQALDEYAAMLRIRQHNMMMGYEM